MQNRGSDHVGMADDQHATFGVAGANPIEILAPSVEATTGALAWAATRVKITRVGEADGRLVLFSARGELRESPHQGETR